MEVIMTDFRRQLGGNRWQDWINLLLAIWLFISPWVLNFYPGSSSSVAQAAWNAWILGIVIGVFSIAALVKARPWEEWINLLAGAWVFISPWVLGYASTPQALWNALVIGALVFILAIWDLNTMPAIAGERARLHG
jgi:hypothetical protein